MTPEFIEPEAGALWNAYCSRNKSLFVSLPWHLSREFQHCVADRLEAAYAACDSAEPEMQRLQVAFASIGDPQDNLCKMIADRFVDNDTMAIFPLPLLRAAARAIGNRFRSAVSHLYSCGAM